MGDWEKTSRCDSQATFVEIAGRCKVGERELEILEMSGKYTASDFFYSIGHKNKLDPFLVMMATHEVEWNYNRKELVEQKEDDGAGNWVTIPHEDWLDSNDCGKIRRLWDVCAAMCKEDTREIFDCNPTSVRRRSIVEVQEAIDAFQRWYPGLEFSTRTQPSKQLLDTLNSESAPGRLKSYHAWEVIISVEEERVILLYMSDEQKRKVGKAPKLALAMANDGRVEGSEEVVTLVKDDSTHLPTAFTTLQETFLTRRNAYGIENLIDPNEMQNVQTIILDKFREPPANGYRGPSLNEVRHFDKQWWYRVLQRVNRKEGSLWDLYGDTVSTNDPLWQILAQKALGTPDQGLYNGAGKSSTMPGPNGGNPNNPEPKRCEQCGKARKDHPNKRIVSNGKGFCSLAKKTDAPGDAAAKGKGKGKKGKKGNKGKGKGGGKGKSNAPPHMANLAQRMPASAEFPQGQPVCFWAHSPGGSTCSLGDGCWMSHKCPVFVNGAPCAKNHLASQHA